MITHAATNPAKPIAPTTKCIMPCQLIGVPLSGVPGGSLTLDRR
jgi:hypothetical protein